MATSIKFRNVYALYDDIDAGIIENLLEDLEIVCIVKSLEPFKEDSLDKKNAYTKHIAVEVDKWDSAVEIISAAIDSGLISNDGAFAKHT